MAQYIVKLTPQLVTPLTEGSMDEHLVNGYSIQRTGYFDIFNGTSRKRLTRVADGDTIDDTIATWADNPNLDLVASD